MNCPTCNAENKETRVYETKYINSLTVRCKICLKCGAKWKTQETIFIEKESVNNVCSPFEKITNDNETRRKLLGENKRDELRNNAQKIVLDALISIGEKALKKTMPQKNIDEYTRYCITEEGKEFLRKLLGKKNENKEEDDFELDIDEEIDFENLRIIEGEEEDFQDDDYFADRILNDEFREYYDNYYDFFKPE